MFQVTMGYRFDYTCNLVRCMLFLVMCHLSDATRFVITFHESNPCERATSLPMCATMVKCYSRRLVVNTDACNVAQGDMSAWMDNVFGNTTVEKVEEDSLIAPNSIPPLKVHGSMLTVRGSEIELMTIVTTLTLESLGWASLPYYWFHLIPMCAYISWSLESIVEVDVARCRIHPTNITEWVDASFANTTQTPIRIVDSAQDAIELPPHTIVGMSNVISLESSIWTDRWWPVSGPNGLRATEVWEFTNASSETVVAILDSGLPLLATPLFTSIAEGYDFISDVTMSNDGDGRDTNWEDPGDSSLECPGLSSWHGTQVAAVLAAANMDEFRGVSSNATIMPIRVLGLCQTGHASDVADAIVWAAGGAIDNVATNPLPASIISMSFSGLGQCPSYLQSAVNQAIASGGILLAAAGNNGASSVDYFPANCVGVIAVEASTKSGVLASYSNTHGTLAAPGGDASNPVVTISLAAAEESLVVVAAMGTSLSVPMVAGFLALALDLYGPEFNLGDTLASFTDDCAVEICGAGIVSFYGAAHALFVRVDNASYYQCSANAVLGFNHTYNDITISLDAQTIAWVSQEVACNVVANAGCPAPGSVSSRGYTTFVLHADGTVQCQGWNYYGQFGIGTTGGNTGLTTVTGLSGVTQINSAHYHTCARLSDGTVKCWGLNQDGQIGDGNRCYMCGPTTPTTVTGLSGVTQINLGWYHTCALMSGGTAKCWGRSSNGQLGVGLPNYIHFQTTPMTVIDLSGVTQIVCGSIHTCALISDGTVKCWGQNSNGQLGDGTTNSRNTPTTVTGLSGVTYIDSTYQHTCAVISDGTVKCWGWNHFGQIGDGTSGTTSTTTPTTVTGLSGVTQISTGWLFSCALMSGGTVQCWGLNNVGQLGDGTTTDKLTPVLVSGLSDAIQIVSGAEHTMIVTCDGRVKSWGTYWGLVPIVVDGVQMSPTDVSDGVIDSDNIPSSSSSSYSSSSMSSFSSSSSSSSSSSNEHCGVRHVWSNSQCVACSSRDVIPEEDVDSYENTQVFHADGSTTWNTYIYLKQALSVSGIFHTGVTHFTVKYSKTNPPVSFMHSAHEEATGSNVFTPPSDDCTVGFSLFKTAYTVTALLITQIESTDAPDMRVAVQICDI